MEPAILRGYQGRGKGVSTLLKVSTYVPTIRSTAPGRVVRRQPLKSMNLCQSPPNNVCRFTGHLGLVILEAALNLNVRRRASYRGGAALRRMTSRKIVAHTKA